MPAVSVITPTYNRAHLVCEAIDSVLKQTFTDFELIIIDDGSTDNTEEVVRSFTDPRLKYIKQVNKGVSAARNTGLKACSGQFVAFLDSDDLYLPEKLALQMAKVESSPEVGLVYGLHTDTNRAKTLKKNMGGFRAPLDLKYLLLGPAFHWSTVLIRRSYLHQVGGFDEKLKIGEEWDLTLRLALAKCHISYVPRYLTVVRLQPVRLSKDLYLHEANTTAILDKIFDDPRLPPELLPMRNTAHAMVFVRHAGSAYLGGQLEVGQKLLEQAIAIDPTLTGEKIDLLVHKLSKHVIGLSLDDTEEILKDIVQHLPGEKPFSKKLKRRLWEKFFLDSAFKAYSLGQLQLCKNYALRALITSPLSLRNRGLVSILVRSLLGSQLDDEHKRSKSKPVIRI